LRRIAFDASRSGADITTGDTPQRRGEPGIQFGGGVRESERKREKEREREKEGMGISDPWPCTCEEDALKIEVMAGRWR